MYYGYIQIPHTVLRLVVIIFVIQHLKVEAEQIDGDAVFPGIVLLGASEEGLREEESRYPENVGRTIVKPVL